MKRANDIFRSMTAANMTVISINGTAYLTIGSSFNYRYRPDYVDVFAPKKNEALEKTKKTSKTRLTKVKKAKKQSVAPNRFDSRTLAGIAAAIDREYEDIYITGETWEEILVSMESQNFFEIMAKSAVKSLANSGQMSNGKYRVSKATCERIWMSEGFTGEQLWPDIVSGIRVQFATWLNPYVDYKDYFIIAGGKLIFKTYLTPRSGKWVSNYCKLMSAVERVLGLETGTKVTWKEVRKKEADKEAKANKRVYKLVHVDCASSLVNDDNHTDFFERNCGTYDMDLVDLYDNAFYDSLFYELKKFVKDDKQFTQMRECLLMQTDGYTVREISDILGIPKSTVNRRLDKALDIFRNKVDKARLKELFSVK